MKLHHIGIATKDITKTATQLHKLFGLGKQKNLVVFDPSQDAYVSYLRLKSHLDIELISGKKIEKLSDKGISYYHLCFSTKNIQNEINSLQKKGAILVSKPTGAPLFRNKLVAFLYTKIGLIELIQISR